MIQQKKVIVKFKENLLDQQQPNAASDFITRLKNGSVPASDWKQLVLKPDFQGVDIKSLNTSIDQDVLVNLVTRANQIRPNFPYTAMYFLSYFSVYCPSTVNPWNLIQELNNWGAVEEAYLAEAPSEDPTVTKTVNTAFGRKDTGYLTPAPAGIDAEYAWTIAGGDGGGAAVGLHFFDIESNWDEQHPDLYPSQPRWTNYGYRHPQRINHGTKVLGIIIASDSEPLPPSSLGIVPHVIKTSLASYWINAVDVNYFAAILFAISQLKFGDVLLLEMQVNQFDKNGNIIRANLPVEYFKHNYHVIHLATWLGIAVVEAAGNNNYDLGNLGKSWLQRPSDEDSGAIIVTAATPWKNGGTPGNPGPPPIPPTPPDYFHVPMPGHNFGDRIDCYAWGDFIYTTQSTGNPTDPPYGNFGGTSGASAIIAGAALSVQGMQVKKHGTRLGALELRSILSDPETGTIAGDQNPPPPNGWQIGVMPDLRAIYQSI